MSSLSTVKSDGRRDRPRKTTTTQSLITQLEKITIRPSDIPYSRYFPRKSPRNRLDPISTTKEKQRALCNVGKGKNARHSKKGNKSGINPTIYQTTAGLEFGRQDCECVGHYSRLSSEFGIGLCGKLSCIDVKKRRVFGTSSLPLLNEIQVDANLNSKVILKHSYSWPLLHSEGISLFSLDTTELTKSPVNSDSPMSKTVDASKHQLDKSNETEQCDINRNERSTKHHRERPTDKIKSKRKSSKDRYHNTRPKPPSWQNFTTVVEECILDNEKSRFELSSADGSDVKTKVRRASSGEIITDKRHRSNIRRTHSMVIDTSEMPEASNLVVPLAQSKPHEFKLREKEFDDILYMEENEQRCRDWLKTLESAEFKPHSLMAPDKKPERILSSNNDMVTCDLELAEDKWDFLISPYPKGKKNAGGL
ncbi:uncharacterized protein LOC117105690 [Anneissia japonica]|uniref:uncharacterized protein LOC117105690 n=1 Tax=Anneissia japonica TaxID=1529436 RepID=UPI001425548F|nr:uncharacterized protein LOC117105690 [Anneissia japonica]